MPWASPKRSAVPPIATAGPRNRRTRTPRPRKKSSSANGADQDDDECIRDECTRPVGLPAAGVEALLLASVEERLRDRGHDQGGDGDAQGDPDPAPCEPLQPEGFPNVHRIRLDDCERERDHDRVDDGAADSELPAEERVRVADGVVVARGCECQRDLQGDEDEPRRRGRHVCDLEAAEGLLEVGDDVVSIFTAYGHAQKALRHSGRRELGSR